MKFLLHVFLLAAFCLPATAKAQFAGGSGTIDAPYQIATPAQFRAIDGYMDRQHVYFELVADIDLGGSDPNGPFWNGGKGWLAFANNSDAEFKGGLDGKGHTIRGLYINRPDQEWATGALFEAISGSVRDLRIEANITSFWTAAGLAGVNMDPGTITSVEVIGTLAGKQPVGGLVGGNYGTIRHSTATVWVSGESTVGGLAGWNNGIIEDSHAGGNVAGSMDVGGLVGRNTGTTGALGIIRRSFATSKVTGTFSSAGGLAGYSDGTISDSYATGEVTGRFGVGSFVGSAYVGTLQRCYSTGKVTGTSVETGTGCFWDLDTTGVPQGESGEGRTTAQLQTAATYGGWNFNTVWQIEPGAYPTLRVSPADAKVTFEGGNGTAENPWLIATARQFNDIRYRLDQHFKLVADIDLGGNDPDGPFWNGGKGWAPIGYGFSTQVHFSGSFDGGGHSITGLYMRRGSSPSVSWGTGLFGRIEGGELRNVRLIDVDLQSAEPYAALAGYNAGSITNSHASGKVYGTDIPIGGLVYANQGYIANSSFEGYVQTSGSYQGVAGGLVAFNSGEITHSSTGGLVANLGGGAGGLVGSNDSGKIEASFSRAGVAATNGNAGGLVATHSNGRIRNSFATGAVTGTWAVGGLVGSSSASLAYDTPAILSSFSTGSVSGGSAHGGLVGTTTHPALVTDSFWNTETSGLATSAAGTGKTSAQLQQAATFSAANWDLNFAWFAPAGAYPTLRPLVEFAGGAGTVENPWRIATVAQLARVRDNLDKAFVLSADIDLGGEDPNGPFWNGGKGWRPLGWEIQNGQLVMQDFTGMLDGAGHALRNLYINTPSTNSVDAVGFIGVMGNAAVVRNLEFTNVDVTAAGPAGAVAGINSGMIHNVIVGGEVVSPILASKIAARHVSYGGGYARLSGTPERPLYVSGADFGRVRLEYVVIGAGNVFSAGPDWIILGPGVRFESNDYVPDGNFSYPQDISGAYPQIPWAPYPQFTALGLNADILVVQPGAIEDTVLAAMQRLAFGDITQNAAGELLLTQPNLVAKLLPVKIIQEIPERFPGPPGVYVSTGGDVEFFLATGRRLTTWPLVMDLPLFRQEAQRRGFVLGGTANGNFKLSVPGTSTYYLTRPYAAFPATLSTQPGLVAYAGALKNVIEYALVYRDAQGRLMQQPLVPRPVDWNALRYSLLYGNDEVRIDAAGDIWIRQATTVTRARLGHKVSSTGAPGGGGVATRQVAGDLNGDSTVDYVINYPNGDVQWLYMYPGQ